MNSLNKVIIYKIKGVNYIGSTKCNLNRRRLNHKSMCWNKKGRQYNYSLYQELRRRNMKNIQLEILVICFIGSKAKSRIEQYYIDKFDSIKNGLNNVRAYTNKKEYDRELDKKNKPIYYQKNKDFLNRKINCPICNGLIMRRQLKRHQRTLRCKTYGLNK